MRKGSTCFVKYKHLEPFCSYQQLVTHS